MQRIPIILILLLLLSCHRYSDSWIALKQAESIVDTDPAQARAVLDSIQYCSLSNNDERMRYYVLRAQAHYKLHDTIPDQDSVISAVTYFSSVDNPRYEMLSKYYKGVILFEYRNNLADAIVCLSDAADIADHLDEYLYAGIIYRNISNIYSEIYGDMNGVKYSKISYERFLKSGSITHINYAALDLSIAYFNKNEWRECVEQGKVAYDLGIKYDDPVLCCESLRMIGTAYMKLDHSDSLVYFFNKILDSYPEYVEENDYVMLSKAYYNLKDFEQSKAMAKIANNAIEQDGWFSALLYKNEGDYENAYNSLVKESFKIDSIVKNLITQNVTSAIDDHLKLLNLEKEKALLVNKNKHLTLTICLLSAIFILIVLIIYIISRRNRFKRKVEERMASLEILVERINNDKTDLIVKFKEVFGLKQSIMENLLYAYYTKSATDNSIGPRNNNRLIKDLESIISDCKDSHSRTFKELESEVNHYMNNILQDFKSDFPNLNDSDYLLFTYTSLGFSTSTLCLFLDCNAKSVHNRRYRIKSFIKNSDTIRKSEYLSLLGS